MNEVDLIGFIYRAALNDDWQSIAVALSEAAGSISTHIFGHDTTVDKSVPAAHLGYSPEMPVSRDRYHQANHGRLSDVVVPEVGKLIQALTVHDRSRGQSPLAMAYGLTSAEAELALALRDGLSLKEHAELRSVSLHTVRNQLKSVFEKTGVHRQAELVALLSRMLDYAANT